MDFGALILTVVVLGFIKLFVLFFSVRIVYRLYGSVYQEHPKKLWYLLPKENVLEIRILWWSLVLFFFSEAFCGVETYILFQSSPYFGALHSFSASLGMGLFCLGMYIFLEKRLVQYGQNRCMMNRLCRDCSKIKNVECKMKIPILLIASMCLLVVVPLFFASTEIMEVNSSRFVLPFPAMNEWFELFKTSRTNYKPLNTVFFLPTSTQIIDYRIIPAIAGFFVVIGLFFVRGDREKIGLGFVSFGAGLLSYSYLQFITLRGTGDLLLGSFGHEIAEFWFLLFIAEFLKRIFVKKSI